MSRAKRPERTADGKAVCFEPGCDAAAGHGNWAYSAWCADHQVRRPGIPGSGWMCAAGCGQIWGRLTDFDAHQVIRNDQARTVTCLSPAELDVTLVQSADGIWLTPAGLQKRERASTLLTAAVA
jgi:hypothetical protein